MQTSERETMLSALALLAPGTPLRDGLDRILQAGMGALILIGDGPPVLNICSGGFLLDAAYSPQRLSELSKMDGAIVLAANASRIARANVHLVPNPNVGTTETGTRHRTAERVARSIDVPVISVSQRMNVISVYVGNEKHQIDPVPRVIARANQAVQTLERYRSRLHEVSISLSALEVEDLVTLRDVVFVLQRLEMVARIANEIEGYIVELGDDGRLVRLQLEEMMGNLGDDRRLVVRDYFHEADAWHLKEALAALSDLDDDDLVDLRKVSSAVHLTEGTPDLEESLSPRGYRMLNRVPRLPESVIDAIIAHFGDLQKVLRATIDELDDVAGVGKLRARAVKEGLSRMAEVSILDRYN